MASYSYQDDLNHMIREMWDTRDMEIPKFTADEIEQLPNILQLISIINIRETDLLKTQHGWNDYSFLEGSMKLHSCQTLLDKNRVYVNNHDPDKFIVNRLESGRFSLKPNLRSHRFLFRGQKEHYSKIQSSFDRHDHNRHVLDNIKVEEFVAMLQTHPLFMMFEHGVHISPRSNPFFFEMNYYGLAQHYNFNTALVDFTSNIYAAAFFATTKNLGNDKYEPYWGTEKNKYGVVYIYELNPFKSFLDGMKTIGLQVYPRTGAQKGFCFEEGCVNVPLEKMVVPLFFKHDQKCSETIYAMMDKGNVLFPKDDLSNIAQEILQSNMVSGDAFAHNLYYNQDEFKVNQKVLRDQDVKIDWHRERFFTKEDLKQYFDNIKNGWWDEFCNQIIFIDDTHECEYKKSLLEIQHNPYYAQYFNPDMYDLLQYNRLEDLRHVKRKMKFFSNS